MELAISKQAILNSLTYGRWTFDDLSLSILKKIKEEQYLLNREREITDNSLKNFTISYYCKIKSPLTSLFYRKIADDNFNKIVLDKIAKEGSLSDFSDEEQLKITRSLDHIKEITTGNLQFIKELSFIKMNSLQFKSASNPHLMCLIILTDQINYDEPYELTRSIVHELAHHELFLINFYDRLILENADGTNTFSPYQKLERPPIGRFHSLWALFRMIQHGKIEGKSVKNELILFNQTILTLENNIMTDFGITLIKTIRKYLENNN